MTFFERRLKEPLLTQLRQGASPDRLSWAVATGATLSLFPLLGTTTGLGLLAGWAFRLNHVALQSANYLMSPLQLLAIPIWIRLGEKVFGLSPVEFNPLTAGHELFSDPRLFFARYGVAALGAIAVWAVASPVLIYGIRRIALPLLKALERKPETSE